MFGIPPRIYIGTPEKYPGQRTRFRKFAWKGDRKTGPKECRQMRRLAGRLEMKAARRERNAKKEQDRNYRNARSFANGSRF